MGAIYEQEKARIEFRVIFNEEPDKHEHEFSNIENLILVNRYGLYCGDISEAIELTKLHRKIQLQASSLGVELEDDVLVKLIGGNYFGRSK